MYSYENEGCKIRWVWIIVEFAENQTYEKSLSLFNAFAEYVYKSKKKTIPTKSKTHRRAQIRRCVIYVSPLLWFGCQLRDYWHRWNSICGETTGRANPVTSCTGSLCRQLLLYWIILLLIWVGLLAHTATGCHNALCRCKVRNGYSRTRGWRNAVVNIIVTGSQIGCAIHVILWTCNRRLGVGSIIIF